MFRVAVNYVPLPFIWNKDHFHNEQSHHIVTREGPLLYDVVF